MSSLDFKKINMDGGQIQIMQQEKAIFANTGVSFTFFQSILIFHVQRIKNESYMAWAVHGKEAYQFHLFKWILVFLIFYVYNVNILTPHP